MGKLCEHGCEQEYLVKMKQLFEETREKVIRENQEMVNILTFEEFVASISTKDKILKRIFECFVKETMKNSYAQQLHRQQQQQHDTEQDNPQTTISSTIASSSSSSGSSSPSNRVALLLTAHTIASLLLPSSGITPILLGPLNNETHDTE